MQKQRAGAGAGAPASAPRACRSSALSNAFCSRRGFLTPTGHSSVTRGVDLVSRVTQRVVVRRVGRAGRFEEIHSQPNGYFRVENCLLRNGFEEGNRGLKSWLQWQAKHVVQKTVASAVCLGLRTA